MKSENFLTLHRQQYSQTQKRNKDIVKTVHVTSVVQLYFYKLQEYFLCAKNTKIMTLSNSFSLLTIFLGLGTFQLHCCLCRIRKLSDLIKNILTWRSEDERRSCRFVMTWGWVINDVIYIFGWTIPLSVKINFHCKISIRYITNLKMNQLTEC